MFLRCCCYCVFIYSREKTINKAANGLGVALNPFHLKAPLQSIQQKYIVALINVCCIYFCVFLSCLLRCRPYRTLVLDYYILVHVVAPLYRGGVYSNECVYNLQNKRLRLTRYPPHYYIFKKKRSNSIYICLKYIVIIKLVLLCQTFKLL